MEEKKEEGLQLENEALQTVIDSETPLDKNVRLLSPTRMVLRRFFRSKLSIVGLVMLASLFLFSWLGPVFYTRWGETETDRTGNTEYRETDIELGDETFTQVIITDNGVNALAAPSADHILGTDETGMDIFTRLMYGGRLSLSVSFTIVIARSF